LKSLITNIQRFSLTDGDGIRTTVFFKGCNMRCSWCHNPETLSFGAELMFYPAKCIGCGKCFEACPKGAHKVVDGVHIIDREACISCGKCADVCYAEALVMCGKEMTIEEIVAEVVQDKPYYESSGGGVTLSGGEVLCNLDFAKELTLALKKEGIKVAVETNLSLPFEKAKELLSSVDAVMCDVKLYDCAAHKAHTGIGNEKILENVLLLDTLGVPVTVRTPMIPGITDNEENVKSIAKHVCGMKNLYRYELLNFNPLGEGKYKSLDMTNAHEDARPLGKDKLDVLKACAESTGITVKVV